MVCVERKKRGIATISVYRLLTMSKSMIVLTNNSQHVSYFHRKTPHDVLCGAGWSARLADVDRRSIDADVGLGVRTVRTMRLEAVTTDTGVVGLLDDGLGDFVHEGDLGWLRSEIRVWLAHLAHLLVCN